MNFTKLSLLGAISSLAILPAESAAAGPAPTPVVPPADSFAGLLEPIPDATAKLQMANEQEAQQARLIPAQYVGFYVGSRRHHHHHHHYRRVYRPYIGPYVGFYSATTTTIITTTTATTDERSR